jgi:hypothetical protein
MQFQSPFDEFRHTELLRVASVQVVNRTWSTQTRNLMVAV